jgi:hemerythrin-like domain-containing protein
MKPLEILKNEHGLIRRYLDLLESASIQMEGGKRPPREFFEKGIRFGREFADRYHHHKEELILFVLLAQRHEGALDGEIESLRHQHETGRDHVADIGAALDGYEAGNPVKTDQIRAALRAYVPMLRDHIHTEDHVFFPLAAEKLTAEEHAQLESEFERARQKAGLDAFEEYHKLVVDMSSLLTHL